MAASTDSRVGRGPWPVHGQLVLQVADPGLQAVPLLQDVLQLGQGELWTVPLLILLLLGRGDQVEVLALLLGAAKATGKDLHLAVAVVELE